LLGLWNLCALITGLAFDEFLAHRLATNPLVDHNKGFFEQQRTIKILLADPP